MKAVTLTLIASLALVMAGCAYRPYAKNPGNPGTPSFIAPYGSAGSHANSAMAARPVRHYTLER